jgi:hypothetical protein
MTERPKLTERERSVLYTYYNERKRVAELQREEVRRLLETGEWVSRKGAREAARHMLLYAELVAEVDRLGQVLWRMGRTGEL